MEIAMKSLVIEPGKTPDARAERAQMRAILDYLAGGVQALETWRRRHKSSMQFARIESRLLRDLGISDAQRFIEVNKPFWEK
jgi:uncharacterized protein YjiS (DUF1127 family)